MRTNIVAEARAQPARKIRRELGANERVKRQKSERKRRSLLHDFFYSFNDAVSLDFSDDDLQTARQQVSTITATSTRERAPAFARC